MLDFILSGKARDEVVSDICGYLSDIKDKIDRNELGIEQYIITKQLTKAPQDYPDAKSQPHVAVAKVRPSPNPSPNPNVHPSPSPRPQP